MDKPANRYVRIIEHIFHSKFQPGISDIIFDREDIERTAQHLGIATPKNIGDVLYSFRFRTAMPDSIQAVTPEGMAWTIELAGKGRYRFALKSVALLEVTPNQLLAETKIPESTPGLVARYALNDEQALLAKVRYNRLLDIFTGITCYSLQNHLRTTVPGYGQVETDEIYVGVDRKGVQYAIPVQAKGGRDRLTTVQIAQDIALCKIKFPALVCRAIGAQFMRGDVIALFAFEETETGISIVAEKHYRLVPPDEITPDELFAYRTRLTEE